MNIQRSSVTGRLKTSIHNGEGRVKINASHNIKSGVGVRISEQEHICSVHHIQFHSMGPICPLQMARAEVRPGAWVHRAGGFNQAV